MAEFLQLLGTASRELASPVCMPPTPHTWEPRLKLDLPQPISLLSQDFTSLLSACPEMQYLPTPPPGLSEPNTARTFAISRPRLLSFIAPAFPPSTRGPSPFFLISAFLWAWTTHARSTSNPHTLTTPPPQPFSTPTTGPPNPSSPPPRPSPTKSTTTSATPSSPPPPPSPTRTSSAAPHTTRALSSPSQRPSPPPTTLSTSSSCSRAPRCLQRRRTCRRWRWCWIRGRRGISR